MGVTTLAPLQLDLRSLAITGVIATGSAKLQRISTNLADSKTRVLRRLSEGLRELADAAPGDAVGLLLSLFSLSRAVLSTQHESAPKGKLTPIPQRAPSETSTRGSGRVISAMRAALSTRGPERLKTLEQHPETLVDLRLSGLLPAALDDTPIAGFVEEQLSKLARVDASKLDAIEASFSGAAAADARRLAIITATDSARGAKLAWKLLDQAPKPPLQAQIATSLASEPDALSVLLKYSRGSYFVRVAAFGALAQRSEPEAVSAIAAQLGKPGRELYSSRPISFSVLERQAFEHMNHPDLLSKMWYALSDPNIPFESRDENWSRDDWFEAYTRCLASSGSVEELRSACTSAWRSKSLLSMTCQIMAPMILDHLDEVPDEAILPLIEVLKEIAHPAAGRAALSMIHRVITSSSFRQPQARSLVSRLCDHLHPADAQDLKLLIAQLDDPEDYRLDSYLERLEREIEASKR